ncbi:MAG: NosR/NirI family nitrous oxide reductase transcriptional regulator [Mariniblastus sp.]
MTQLPVVNPSSTKRWHGVGVHCFRVGLFLAILGLIRYVHRQTELVVSGLAENRQVVELVKSRLSPDATIGQYDSVFGGHPIRDRNEQILGRIVQTAPSSDTIVGYSGPTNCLIVLDPANKIQTIAILSSLDTIDHVEIVKADQVFLDSFQGFTFDTTDGWEDIDGVSGATLTSYAVISSVANRLGAKAPNLKFSETPSLEKVTNLFPEAATVEPAESTSLWHVRNVNHQLIGTVLSTTPAADHLSGYQGPTATLVAFDLNGSCRGVVVDQTYDNEPYASYLNDDYFFLSLYKGKDLRQLAEFSPDENGVEGVSGATMTSLSIAAGIQLAAEKSQLVSQEPERIRNIQTRSPLSYWADGLTGLLTLMGVSLSFTRLRGHAWFRIVFQLAVIALLGFTSGHMVSQASLAGWASHSIPVRVAPGLVLLTLAALLVPILSKHQPYCQHICPFGAMQQLGRNRLGWRLRIPNSVARWLKLIPVAILTWVVVAVLTRSSFNLASIEPFDAFAFRVAGWATLSIFAVGMLASLFSPMAYCRFGCPTGALLGFLKFSSKSHQWSIRDWAALSLFALALVLMQFQA